MKKTVTASVGEGTGFGPPDDINLNNKVLHARILEVSEREGIFDVDPEDPSKGKKMQVSFKFENLSAVKGWDNAEGAWFWGNTGDKLVPNPNCKLYNWVCAIYEVDGLSEGFVVDFDEMTGMECRILIQAKSKADGSKSHRVREVLPLDD